MHRFLCYPSEGRKLPPDLHGAHLVGTNENVPVRGEIHWEAGAIRCQPRAQDPIALSLLWPVKGFGTVQLQTTRLPPREAPYNLHVELARHQLMRLTVKREEWGLFDYSGMEEIAARIDQSRDAFIRALQEDKPQAAARHGDESLATGLWAAEEMTRFHAAVFLHRRQQSGGFAKPFLAAAIPDGCRSPALPQRLGELFDVAYIPLVWRSIQPTEHGPQWEAVDACVEACSAARLALRGGPLLTFGVRSVPDWMYIWENDFEAIYEAAREHVERTVKRYAKQVQSWVVASGLQADSVFGFSFEQTMELTRMAAAVTKQIAPRSQVLIDLAQPWGEYYARNPQTVPPLYYADMAVQSGISFDGFGLQFVFGLDAEGYHFRDPFQLSALIDKLANLGKALHVTALGAPSRPVADAATSGEWHAPWSDELQAEWLHTVCEVALSKPYIETVCVQPLVDGPESVIPTGGVLREDYTPKPAFGRLAALRKRLVNHPAK
ncbi:MAG: endo-1,4-beta-xylanase [Planctomycetota bacterium]